MRSLKRLELYNTTTINAVATFRYKRELFRGELRFISTFYGETLWPENSTEGFKEPRSLVDLTN